MNQSDLSCHAFSQLIVHGEETLSTIGKKNYDLLYV